jgi:RNA polymerase sigma factor (sigma-70 family)
MQELPDDEYLIQSIIAGSKNAFEQLVIKYQGFAFNLAMRFTENNRELAEEITQDVFLKILKNIGNYKNKGKFSTWVYRIIFNTAMTEIRKTNKVVYAESMEDHFDQTVSDDNWNIYNKDSQVVQEEVGKAISKLPKIDGLIVQLFYFNEQNIDEICLILNLKRENVKTKLFRARKKLKDHLSQVFNYI